MSTVGLAQAPLPPGNVTFDTVDFPTTFANTSPITVAWARRLRTKTSISFQEDADETPDVTTTYYVRHGPPFSFRTEVNLGAGTSGTFNFDYKGLNLVEVYAKAGGFTSSILSFYTQVTNATNTVAAGPIGTITDTPPAVDALVRFGGPIGTIGVGPSIIPHVSGDLGSALTVSGPVGDVSIPAGGLMPQVSILPIMGHVPHTASASGEIGTITVDAPTGLRTLEAAAAGGIGTITIDAVEGTSAESADASGDIGTITVSGIDGDISISAAASGNIGTVTTDPPSGKETSTHLYWRIELFYPQRTGGAFAFSELGFCSTIGGSNVAVGGTASADETFSGTNVTNLFDGSSTTVWSSTDGRIGQTITYEFASAVDIAEVYLTTRNDAPTFYDQVPLKFGLSHSDNGTDWTKVASFVVASGTFTGGGQTARFTVPSLSPTGAHTYWSIEEWTNAGGLFAAPSVAELGFCATIGGPTQTTGGTASADENFSGFPASQAFDGNTSTLWSANTGPTRGINLRYQFASPVSVGQIYIISRNDSSYPQTPETGWVMMSDDGFNWAPAWEFSFAIWSSATQTQTSNP